MNPLICSNRKKKNIFQGGCRIRLVDRETKTVLHSYHMLGPDTAPKFRSAEDTTTYYDFQPSKAEVFEYAKTLKFE